MTRSSLTRPVDWPTPDVDHYAYHLALAPHEILVRGAQLLGGARPPGGKAALEHLLLDAWQDSVATADSWENLSPQTRAALSYLGALGGATTTGLLLALGCARPDAWPLDGEARAPGPTAADVAQLRDALIAARAAGWLVSSERYSPWHHGGDAGAPHQAARWHPGLAARRVAPPLPTTATPLDVVTAWPVPLLPFLLFLLVSQIRQAGGWTLQRNGTLRLPQQKVFRQLLGAVLEGRAARSPWMSVDAMVECLVRCGQKLDLLVIDDRARLAVAPHWSQALDQPETARAWLHQWMWVAPPQLLQHVKGVSDRSAGGDGAWYYYWAAVARQAADAGPDWVSVASVLPVLDTLLPYLLPSYARSVRPLTDDERRALVAYCLDPPATTRPALGWVELLCYGGPLDILLHLLPALGLADVGVGPLGELAMRPTPGYCAQVRADATAADNAPSAWFASNGDLTIDVATVPLAALAVLAQLVERLSLQGNVMTLGISERSVQAALRAGLTQAAIDAAIAQLRVQAPSWMGAAAQDHQRRQSTYTVVSSVRVAVDHNGVPTLSHGPMPDRPYPDPPFVAQRHRDGALLFAEIGRLEYFARVQRLAVRTPSGWQLTRASVQRAIKNGVSAAVARTWLQTHVLWPDAPQQWVDLLVVSNALQATTGTLVRLPKVSVDAGRLPEGLRAFDAYRLGNDIPFLLVPHEQLAAFEAALRAAGLAEG